jgi:hypothetical protein
MVCDLRVLPETAPPSFEKGITRLTTTTGGSSASLFHPEKGRFVF